MGKLLNLQRTASEWTEANPVLGLGQVGMERFTRKSKLGDGRTRWNDLTYQVTENTVAEMVQTAVESLDLGSVIPSGPDTSSASRFVPVVVYVGESNSGGQASLGALSTQEKLARPAVQILNNTTFEFEPLHIGVNANIDHYNLPPNSTHGWEAGLANEVEAHEWSSDTVYLLKTGQGGSTLAQWAQGQTYWTKFVQRINAAKQLFAEMGVTPLWYVYHTHGINDAIAGTPVATWKAEMKELHTRIRGELGFCPILLVEEPDQYPTYNAAMAEIANETAGNFMVDTGGLTMDDSNHWNSAGMKELSHRLALYAWRWGQSEAYMLGQAYALFAGGLSSGTPSAGGSGGGDSGSGSGSGTDPFAGLSAFTPVNWDDHLHTENYSGAARRYEMGLPAGAGLLTNPLNAAQPFGVQIEYPTLDGTNAIIVYLSGSPNDGTVGAGAAYSQSSGETYAAGVFQYGGSVFFVNSGSGQTSAGTSGATNRLRMVKHGNDVDLYRSTDNGSTWSKIGSLPNALVGFTNLYIKCLFAIEQVGQSIPVSLARPA